MPSLLRIPAAGRLAPHLWFCAAAAAFACLPAAHAAGVGDGTASSYCVSTGGRLAVLKPWSGTNRDPAQWVAYGGSVSACIYTAPDRSQITIWNSTLTSTLPTMAALAYYAMVPYTGPGGSADPSVYYCQQLGGAWQIGNGADGGGWATSAGSRIYGMCVFGDGSAIDAWGLAYHSVGTVRGVDLSTVLKFANPY